jgi:hypothetical protein
MGYVSLPLAVVFIVEKHGRPFVMVAIYKPGKDNLNVEGL